MSIRRTAHEKPSAIRNTPAVAVGRASQAPESLSALTGPLSGGTGSEFVRQALLAVVCPTTVEMTPAVLTKRTRQPCCSVTRNPVPGVVWKLGVETPAPPTSNGMAAD